MLIKNNSARYGLIAILFHWIIAALIIGLLCLGLYMVRIPISLSKLKLYGWHKEIGILVLMLVALRMLWRISNITPLLPAYMPAWQKLAARLVHYLFYVLMFAIPLTGWMMSSAAGLPVSFFGLFVLPDLMGPDESLRHLLQETHEWLAYLLIGAIGLHVAATIQHYLIYRDNLLRRMLP